MLSKSRMMLYMVVLKKTVLSSITTPLSFLLLAWVLLVCTNMNATWISFYSWLIRHAWEFIIRIILEQLHKNVWNLVIKGLSTIPPMVPWRLVLLILNQVIIGCTENDFSSFLLISVVQLGFGTWSILQVASTFSWQADRHGQDMVFIPTTSWKDY